MVKRIINKAGLPIIIVFLVICALSGFYTVKTGEEAVILRFGKYINTVAIGGLKWKVPFVDKAIKVNLSEVKRLEFGFKTVTEGNKTQNAKYEQIPEDALMLTSDENLAVVETIVQYKISDSVKYLFSVDDQSGTLRVAGESVIRRVIANHQLDEALTNNKTAIQQEIKDDLQKICDKYNFGIVIVAAQLQDVVPPQEVDAAFKDVSSAKEDKNSAINQANAYKNEKIPKARGNASEIINQAEAYKGDRIARAKGDVSNFNQVLDKYKDSKEVTRTRMYLEMLEKVLPNVEKYVVDENGSTLKVLPLTQDLVQAQDKAN